MAWFKYLTTDSSIAASPYVERYIYPPIKRRFDCNQS